MGGVMTYKVWKIWEKSRFFRYFFKFKLIFHKIRSVSKTTDHMILKFNLSYLRKNKNFQIGTCGFRDINFRKFVSENHAKQSVT